MKGTFLVHRFFYVNTLLYTHAHTHTPTAAHTRTHAHTHTLYALWAKIDQLGLFN